MEFYFAEATASPGLLEALGVDVKLLVAQSIAFLVLLALLSKFAFPAIIRMIDKREEAIRTAADASKEAEKKAAEAADKVEKLLKTAKTEAAEIVSTAKAEAVSLTEKSEKKAKDQADRIVDDARESIGKEVIAARKSLHNEMIDLVATATAKVTAETATDQVDRDLVAAALKEAK